MKVIAQPNWLDLLDDHARNSLSSNNERIVTGSSDILVNPALEDKDDSKIADQILSILDNARLTPGLREIEDDNLSKFGPRSISIPWEERRQSLYDYTFPQLSLDDLGDFQAVESLLNPDDRVSRLKVLRPLSVDQAAGHLIPRSNSGLPYMRRKRQVVGDAVEQFHQQNGVWPCVTFTRTQEQQKTRNIWGFSIFDTLAETRYFQPWLRIEKQLDWRAALHGPDEVDRAITRMFMMKQDGEVLQGVDFSSYDASVHPTLSMVAFAYISNAFQSAHQDEILKMARRFVSIPIYCPDGQIESLHGVPSGSTFTNSVDSLVQYVAGAVTHGKGHTLQQGEFQIQGDDGIYLVPESERETLLSSFKDIGLNLNEDKSRVSEDDGTFLQRYYHPTYLSRDGGRGLGGVYSLFRAANRIKYLERWTNFDQEGIEGGDYFALRTVMILENCKHHPGFDQFVRLVQSWDKYGLRFTQQGLHAFSRMQESRARANLFGAETDFAGGIDRFETMKLLRR